MGLRVPFLVEPFRDILPIHKDIGHEAIVDISSMRDEMDQFVVKQLFQSQFSCRSAWLAHLRCVDALEPDSLGSIVKSVAIDHVDLPSVDRALCSAESREGLSPEQRLEASAIGSAQSVAPLVRVESFFTVRPVGVDGASGLRGWLPAEIAGGAGREGIG